MEKNFKVKLLNFWNSLKEYLVFGLLIFGFIFPSYVGYQLLGYIGGWTFLFFPAYMAIGLFLHGTITEFVKKRRYKENYQANMLIGRGDALLGAITYGIPPIIGLIYNTYQYFKYFF